MADQTAFTAHPRRQLLCMAVAWLALGPAFSQALSGESLATALADTGCELLSSPTYRARALVFHPDGHGGAPLLGRVKIEEWKAMSSAP